MRKRVRGLIFGAGVWGAVSVGAGLAFEDFDGNGQGFQSGSSWGRYATTTAEIEPGFGSHAVCASGGESDRALASILDLTSDGTYYVAALYRVNATSEYGGFKLAQGNDATGPQLMWRNSGGYRLYKEGWMSAADVGTFAANTTYLGVMKLTARAAGPDEMSVVLYDISAGEAVPVAPPTTWEGTYSTTFTRSAIDRVRLLGYTSVGTSFDNIVVTDDWADIVAAASPNPPPPVRMFDDFDGNDGGFASKTWSGSYLDFATPYAAYPGGRAFQVYGDSTAESGSARGMNPVDLSGDATYYLACHYYSAGAAHDQYSVIKLRSGTVTGPSILWRNNGTADAYVGNGATASELSIQAGKLYFCVLKIDCSASGTDAVSLNLYDVEAGASVPSSAPGVWQTAGMGGNSVADFPITSADNIQLIGRGSLDATFDNVTFTTEWDDVFAAAQLPVRGRAESPGPEPGRETVNYLTTRALQWLPTADPYLSSIDRYEVYFYGKPTAAVTPADPDFSAVLPLDNGTSNILAVALQPDHTYFWRVDTALQWDSAEVSGNLSDTIEGAAWSFSTAGAVRELFVAPDGDDGNPGTEGSPLATPVGARNRLRTLGIPEDGATVWFRGGRYLITQSLALDAQDSGYEDAPVVYSAYPGEEVVFDGSRMVPTAGFTLVEDAGTLARLHPDGRGRVWSAPITDATLRARLSNPDAQLTLNDRMARQSRFPNVGFDYVQSTDVSVETPQAEGTTASPLGGRITLRGTPQGDWAAELTRVKKARLRGYVSAVWLRETLRLHSVDGAGTIRLMDGSRYGLNNISTRRPFFDNLLCEIDEPGEWYYDNLENRLYVLPYGDHMDADSVLGVWDGPLMFDVAANHVRIENITMQCAGESGGYVDIHGARVVVAGCTLRYTPPGIAAFNIWSDARSSGLLSCDLYDNDGGGRLYAGSVGPYGIEAGDCFIENCHFTQVDATGFYGSVAAIKGAGNRFRNNLCHNHNGQIVTVTGTDHLVEHNEIFNTGIEEGDGGSFYQGASFSSANNLFRQNFWHHIICIPGMYERAAIYSDDGDCFDRVEENVFYKAGTCFKMNKGAGHVASRNVMVDSRKAIDVLGASSATSMYNTDMSHLDSHTSTKDAHLYHGLFQFGATGWESAANSSNWNEWISPYWRTRYPTLDDLFDKWWADQAMNKYSVFRRNAEYSNAYGSATAQDTEYLSNLNAFKDPATLDFSLKKPLPGWGDPIAFHRIGLRQDRYRPVPPDKATYRAAARERWEGIASEASGGYNPDTIGARIYFNSGKLVRGLYVPVDLGLFAATDDVGSASPMGSATHTEGVYAVEGGGVDIWDTADSFQFLHAPIQGDAALDARTLSIENTHTWTKVGIMMRESTDAGSKFVMVMHRPDGQVAMQWRDATDAAAGWSGVLTGGTGTMKHLRLTRNGNRFAGYYSTDGESWTLLAEHTVAMNAHLLAGLGVASHINGTLCEARFDRVSLLSELDVDGDGVPDAWETAYFGSSTLSDGSGDQDGDGFIDLHEFRAGTDPTNALSALRFVEMDGGALAWSSVEGKRYDLWSSASLTGAWQLVMGDIPATTNLTRVPVVPAAAAAFFQLKLRE